MTNPPAMDTQQTLDEACADLHQAVDGFKAHWLANHAITPGEWPLRMAPGDWFEMFLAHKTSGDVS